VIILCRGPAAPIKKLPDTEEADEKIDELAKSRTVHLRRHSGLSGIVVFYNILNRDDSGQAGMTLKEGSSTFYECIKFYLKEKSAVIRI
jgi:hypothetical protein